MKWVLAARLITSLMFWSTSSQSSSIQMWRIDWSTLLSWAFWWSYWRMWRTPTWRCVFVLFLVNSSATRQWLAMMLLRVASQLYSVRLSRTRMKKSEEKLSLLWVSFSFMQPHSLMMNMLILSGKFHLLLSKFWSNAWTLQKMRLLGFTPARLLRISQLSRLVQAAHSPTSMSWLCSSMSITQWQMKYLKSLLQSPSRTSASSTQRFSQQSSPLWQVETLQLRFTKEHLASSKHSSQCWTLP